jgi:rhodanese-related sulfurtransferase
MKAMRSMSSMAWMTIGGVLVWTVPACVMAQGEAVSAQVSAKIPVLSRAQIDAALAQPEKVLFIDVRRPDEVSEIGGFSAYFSIQLSELERLWPIIPKDRDLVVVSNHAARGVKGAELLAAKGLRVIGAVGRKPMRRTVAPFRTRRW